MNREEKVLCLAMVFGDGSIHKDHPFITLTHGAAQKPYLEWKARILEEATGKKLKISEKNWNGHVGYYTTVMHKFFRVLRDRCYDENRTPVFRRKMLDKLTPKALAIWYMDDGSLYPKKRNGKIHAYELCISTCCDEANAQNIVDYFAEKWSVNFTIKRNKGQCSVRCGTAEARKFLAIVEPFIVDCLRYKASM